MDKRFTEIRPQICKNPPFGSEPPLFDIMEHYYMSHGIEPTKAKKLARDYVREWVKVESSNDQGKGQTPQADVPLDPPVGREGD